MQLSFLSGPEGKNWAGKFNFCKLQSQAEMMFGSTRFSKLFNPKAILSIFVITFELEIRPRSTPLQ